MKQIIHKIIRNLGYTLLKSKYMAAGVSLERDLAENIDLKKVRTVFDVGANKGVMSLYFSEIFPNAKVHSFEPISSTFKLLQQTTKNSDNVKCHLLGFAETPGKVKVYLQSDHGLNSINEEVNRPDEKLGGNFEEITLSTVSDFCKGNNIESIDLLKTDAEGLDLKIIRGAEPLLKARKIKCILAEVGFGEDNKRNTFFEELRRYLYTHNYKVRGFYDQSNFGNKSYMTCANALFMLQDQNAKT